MSCSWSTPSYDNGVRLTVRANELSDKWVQGTHSILLWARFPPSIGVGGPRPGRLRVTVASTGTAIWADESGRGLPKSTFSRGGFLQARGCRTGKPTERTMEPSQRWERQSPQVSWEAFVSQCKWVSVFFCPSPESLRRGGVWIQ